MLTGLSFPSLGYICVFPSQDARAVPPRSPLLVADACSSGQLPFSQVPNTHTKMASPRAQTSHRPASAGPRLLLVSVTDPIFASPSPCLTAHSKTHSKTTTTDSPRTSGKTAVVGRFVGTVGCCVSAARSLPGQEARQKVGGRYPGKGIVPLV